MSEGSEEDGRQRERKKSKKDKKKHKKTKKKKREGRVNLSYDDEEEKSGGEDGSDVGKSSDLEVRRASGG